MASGADDETVRLWDSTSGRELKVFQGHSAEITAIAFSKSGQLLASAAADMSVKLWDIASGASRGTILGHRVEVLSLAFSPDGNLFATGGRDGSIKIWDANSLTERQTLRGHTKLVRSLAFSPDSRRLVSGSWDWSARVWDLGTGQSLLLQGHESPSVAFAIRPMVEACLTASWDRTARIWDASTGTVLKQLSGHTDRLSSAAISSDARLLHLEAGMARPAWNRFDRRRRAGRPAIPRMTRSGSIVRSAVEKTRRATPPPHPAPVRPAKRLAPTIHFEPATQAN